MDLTEKQRDVLEGLAGYERPVSVRQLTDRLERPAARSVRYGYDEVRSQLERLVRKGAATRDKPGGRVLYEVSEAGKAALPKATPDA